MTSFIDDNGNELDYSGDDFAITKQIISFNNIRLKGNVSINIKISNSTNNKAILNYFGPDQLNVTVKTRFNLIKNGNKIDRGYVIITSIDEEIECFFVSGNSNLFELIDFNCNEIVTTRWDIDLRANPTSYFTNTSGIIIPLVDFIFGAEKYSNVWYESLTVSTTPESGKMTEFIPCLYIHTLLTEIFIKANVKIDGDLLTDKFFKTIIVTPENVDNILNVNLDGILLDNIVKPEHIAPKIKVIDLLKWISITFGCLLDYDTDSNSLSFNMLDKLDVSQAEDWSAYYRRHKTDVDKYYDLNYIRYKENDEDNQAIYNNTRDALYGDLKLDSNKNDGSTNDVYKSPFQASYDKTGSTPLKWATPVCELYRLTDKDHYSFTSVSASALVSSRDGAGSAAQFNGSFTFPASLDRMIFRVDSGIYKGYHVCLSNALGSTSGPTLITSDMVFNGTSSGTIHTQDVEKINGHKILSVIPNCTPSYFCQYPTIYTGFTLGGGAALTTVATAYFHKKTTIYSLLNQYKQGLSYGPIDESNRNDSTIKDTYLNTISGLLTNAPIRGYFNLPESVFYNYRFGFIFIRTEELTGYFIAEMIRNYTSSTKEVEVLLSRVNT